MEKHIQSQIASTETPIIEFKDQNFKGEFTTIYNQRGYCVIQFKGNGSLKTAEENIWLLQHFLGTPVMVKNNDGSFLTRITTDPEAYPDNVFRPVSDNGLQSPHCDGAYEKNPPSNIVMYVYQRAETGGESLIMPGTDLIEKCGDGLLTSLLSKSFYTVARGENRMQTRPVLTIGEDLIQICWADHEYMQPNNLIVPSEHQKAFREFQEIVLDEANQTKLMLQEDQALVVNNHSTLHGRSPFKGDRELSRLWTESKPGLNNGILDRTLVERLKALK